MSKVDKVNKVAEFLETRGFDLNAKRWTLHSGHMGVFMKGDFAGYSLFGLAQYVAKDLGIKIDYEDE